MIRITKKIRRAFFTQKGDGFWYLTDPGAFAEFIANGVRTHIIKTARYATQPFAIGDTIIITHTIRMD